MTALSTDAPPTPPVPPAAPAHAPPSLCRRGPARLHLTLKSGKCPRMSRGRIHVRAGKTFVLQVTPPDPQAKVEVTTEPALHTVVTFGPVSDGGTVPTYYGEYTGQLPQRVLPWPVTAKLFVVVRDGMPNPCRITIPVTVWPSVGLMLTWWVLVFLGLVGVRWQRAVATSSSLWSVLPQFRDDLPNLVGLFLLGAPVLALLHLLGWVATAGAPAGDG